jgi:non-ribosomal peptide synthetase component E (peptide arylation enzyme)
MSKRDEHKSLIAKLKGYYQSAEHEAAKAAPFYVTGDGVMFADPKEVIRSINVKKQLIAFESLRSEILKEKQDIETKLHGSLDTAL